jgi:16S rRNA C967 or C1407 C5-methylase (RsmB/RsmF family)/NOL1/NOP2/fmu family ribosome biogenesis protein
VQLPEKFLESLKELTGYDERSFLDVHEQGEQVTSIRLNPSKYKKGSHPSLESSHPVLSDLAEVPWTKHGYYLSKRPSFTFDPLFHAGLYYVQEASSMFLEQAFKQYTDLSKPLRVLDLSAAPGGKTTHIQSLISEDSLLVSNEVIRNRSLVLKDNVIKWGSANVIVTNNDPSSFKKLKGYFDVIVVDAPCSGSGMFRKDADAIKEWSLNNVALCSQRQQRILADVLPSLKTNGVLIYSTCSYSLEEDEEIGSWIQKEFSMQALEIPIDPSWGIVESRQSGTVGYRFYPGKLKGEGFFLSCFRKLEDEGENKFRPQKVEKAGVKEMEAIAGWVKQEGFDFLKHKESIYAFPSALKNELETVLSLLNIIYAGTAIGQVMKGRLVPDHALALSGILKKGLPSTGLDLDNAIKYLQRQEMNLDPGEKGWQTVNYEGFNLGWINSLANRINNYYPKELRILKQQNDGPFEK